jgi:hypothetical protein
MEPHAQREKQVQNDESSITVSSPFLPQVTVFLPQVVEKFT